MGVAMAFKLMEMRFPQDAERYANLGAFIHDGGQD
jgi:hypothetical protein